MLEQARSPTGRVIDRIHIHTGPDIAKNRLKQLGCKANGCFVKLFVKFLIKTTGCIFFVQFLDAGLLVAKLGEMECGQFVGKAPLSLAV